VRLFDECPVTFGDFRHGSHSDIHSMTRTKGKGKERKAALNQPSSPVFLHPSFKRSKRSKRIPRTHASDRQTEHVHKPLLLLSMQSMYVKHTNEERKDVFV